MFYKYISPVFFICSKWNRFIRGTIAGKMKFAIQYVDMSRIEYFFIKVAFLFTMRIRRYHGLFFIIERPKWMEKYGFTKEQNA